MVTAGPDLALISPCMSLSEIHSHFFNFSANINFYVKIYRPIVHQCLQGLHRVRPNKKGFFYVDVNGFFLSECGVLSQLLSCPV